MVDFRRRRSRRRAVRGLSLALCACVAIGILVFSPTMRPVIVSAADDALSQKGLGPQNEADKELLETLRGSTPAEVAAEVRGLDPETLKNIGKYLPASIGNLDGLPYGIRDHLNRRALRTRTALTKKRLSAHPDDKPTATALAAYEAIAKALKPTRPKRQLILLTSDQTPLAAISVGNLDTAQQVTWQIPGMGTYTTDMPLWSLAAKNLYDVQGAVGGRKERAVVAWMGYLPPPPPPSIEAARGFYAEAGAPNLVRDIGGFRAARADIESVEQSIVGHSYGTTLAANALASSDLGIRALVMLGSAGVEKTIGAASNLHAGTVYACEASRDPQATLGRFSRKDPRSPSFGALRLRRRPEEEASAGDRPRADPALQLERQCQVISLDTDRRRLRPPQAIRGASLAIRLPGSRYGVPRQHSHRDHTGFHQKPQQRPRAGEPARPSPAGLTRRSADMPQCLTLPPDTGPRPALVSAATATPAAATAKG